VRAAAVLPSGEKAVEFFLTFSNIIFKKFYEYFKFSHSAVLVQQSVILKFYHHASSASIRCI